MDTGLSRNKWYKPHINNDIHSTDVKGSSSKPLEFTIPCPICEKRAFDISELPQHAVFIRLKCPHCHNIVETSVFASLAG